MANSLTKAEEKTWSMAAHMSALAGIIFPLGLVLGPLLVWLLKRHDSNLVDENGKEALNFQITVIGASFICVVLSVAIKLFMILAFFVGICGLGFAVYGGLQAKKTGSYSYPFVIRLIK